jgi:hypothetical protein
MRREFASLLDAAIAMDVTLEDAQGIESAEAADPVGEDRPEVVDARDVEESPDAQIAEGREKFSRVRLETIDAPSTLCFGEPALATLFTARALALRAFGSLASLALTRGGLLLLHGCFALRDRGS